MTDEPKIPVAYAELIHVVLSTVSHALSEIDYPTHNIDIVLHAYRSRRDKHLKQAGYSNEQIVLFTDAAATAICSWIEDSVNKMGEETDFHKWTEEMKRQ